MNFLKFISPVVFTFLPPTLVLCSINVVVLMTVLSYSGHGNSRCSITGNWTCFSFWRRLSSHPRGFFSSNWLEGSCRLLNSVSWQSRSGHVWTLLNALSINVVPSHLDLQPTFCFFWLRFSKDFFWNFLYVKVLISIACTQNVKILYYSFIICSLTLVNISYILLAVRSHCVFLFHREIFSLFRLWFVA